MWDYYHRHSGNEGANLAWAATFNGEQDIYFSRIVQSEISAVDGDASHSTVSDLVIHPNPFSTETTISFFETTQAGFVSLEVFDLLGNKVATLLRGRFGGRQEVRWDGRDGNGKRVPGGIYLMRREVDGIEVLGEKMIIIQ